MAIASSIRTGGRPHSTAQGSSSSLPLSPGSCSLSKRSVTAFDPRAVLVRGPPLGHNSSPQPRVLAQSSLHRWAERQFRSHRQAGRRCSFAEPESAAQLLSSWPPAESQPAGDKVSGASPLSPVVPRGRSMEPPGPGPPTHQGRSTVRLKSTPASPHLGRPDRPPPSVPRRRVTVPRREREEALHLSGSPHCRQSPGARITPCCQALLTSVERYLRIAVPFQLGLGPRSGRLPGASCRLSSAQINSVG
ncbi:hypothetical protein NDU88_004386 [Pleurodeles waltl]|uniref:Uncharacterized protein n=1 Tax=Pleurodeles waltl TaxID=8319 RepID=A0AAV7RGS5_PLEWA|nr:hypothetical protein NDU88_004386 [Pleurodeles waltl]